MEPKTTFTIVNQPVIKKRWSTWIHNSSEYF